MPDRLAESINNLIPIFKDLDESLHKNMNYHKRSRSLLWVAVAVMALALFTGAVSLYLVNSMRAIQKSNHQILAGQIQVYQGQISRDTANLAAAAQHLSDAQNIESQEASYIVLLLNQIRNMGGSPPLITIQPPKH